MTSDQIDKLLREPFPRDIAKAYAEDRSDEALLPVLSDWLRDRGVDPEPVIERLKLVDDQRIRRETTEQVVGEQGNLETEELRVQSLSMDVPPAPVVEVEVATSEGPIKVRVRVPADAPASILGANDPEGVYRSWSTFLRASPDIDEREIRLRAEKIAGEDESQAPWAGFEGELLYPEGEASLWLWMGHPPEYLERALDREFPDSDFITAYTDGGGFQSGPRHAFVVDDQLYQLVREGAHGAEVECPFKTWDDEAREEAQDRVVTDSDTLWGMSPHKACRFCEAGLGEEHGFVYIGEGGEYVYARVPEPAELEDED